MNAKFKYAILMLAAGSVVGLVVWPGQDVLTASLTSSVDVKAQTRVIVDMAGREVTIPRQVKAVFSRCPIGTILTYTLNPSKIAGLNWSPSKVEQSFLSKEYLSRPVLGGWYAGKEGNIEEIMKNAPSAFFFSAENAMKNQGAIDQANRLQSMLGMPVILLDAGITKLPAIYRLAGRVLGEENRAARLSAYVEDMLAHIQQTAATIPDSKKVRIYYAEGPEGLNTDPVGSLHSELIELVGAKNVVDIKLAKITKGKGKMGRSRISPEQLIAWNPDIILACHDLGFETETSTYNSVIDDARFASLKAIKNGTVFEIPHMPFNIFDRPPSVNRIIGVKWLAHLIYPDLYPLDIRQEFKDVYQLFYGISLTDEQLNQILTHAER